MSHLFEFVLTDQQSRDLIHFNTRGMYGDDSFPSGFRGHAEDWCNANNLTYGHDYALFTNYRQVTVMFLDKEVAALFKLTFV